MYLLVLLSADDDGVMLLHEGGKQRWRQDEREREREACVLGEGSYKGRGIMEENTGHSKTSSTNTDPTDMITY